LGIPTARKPKSASGSGKRNRKKVESHTKRGKKKGGGERGWLGPGCTAYRAQGKSAEIEGKAAETTTKKKSRPSNEKKTDKKEFKNKKRQGLKEER